MANEAMTPLALRRMMKREGWRVEDVARLTVRDRRTANRWLSGEVEMPKVVVRHLRKLTAEGLGAAMQWSRPA